MAKENGERMAQVNIDQAISQTIPKKPYVAPPLSLLRPAEKEVDQQEDYEAKKEAIRSVLESFGVQSEVKEIKVGPTFSLYTLRVEMPRGRSVSTLVGYENDIAMKMEEKSVRILAPSRGRTPSASRCPTSTAAS